MRARMSRLAWIRASKIGTRSGATASSPPMISSALALEPADPFAEHDAESLQQPPDLVLQLDAHAHKSLPRGQHRPVDIGIVALDLRGLEPTGAHDLRQAAGIMAIGFSHSGRGPEQQISHLATEIAASWGIAITLSGVGVGGHQVSR